VHRGYLIFKTRSLATAEIACITDSMHQSLHRSRSFKVIDVSTNWKPVCDFLLLN